MSPSMKSAFIGLLLLGLVVSETSATVYCPLLTVNLDACVAVSGLASFIVGSNYCPPPCYQGLLGLKAAIALLGDPTGSCDCIKNYLLPLRLNVDAIVKFAGICAVADLKIC